MTRLFDEVLVRTPGKSYTKCVSKNPKHNTIDMEKTLEQHEKYVRILENHGVQVQKLSPLESYPDSIFVQDTALIGKESNTAVICRFGIPLRRGEEESIANMFLEEGYNVKCIEPPGTIEGGDILVTDRKKIFVGISERTNKEGIEQLSKHFSDIDIIKVPVSKVFHLLSGVNFVGDGTLAICPEVVDLDHFKGFELIEISMDKQDTVYKNKPINMLYLGDKKILIPKAYTRTVDILEDFGYTAVKINISEFWKGDAGMTCPMLPIYNDI